MGKTRTIKEIAKSHQAQMSSVHPDDICETIEDAINEYAEQFSLPDNKWVKHKANEQAQFWNDYRGNKTIFDIAEICIETGMNIIINKIKGNKA